MLEVYGGSVAGDVASSPTTSGDAGATVGGWRGPGRLLLFCSRVQPKQGEGSW